MQQARRTFVGQGAGHAPSLASRYLEECHDVINQCLVFGRTCHEVGWTEGGWERIRWGGKVGDIFFFFGGGGGGVHKIIIPRRKSFFFFFFFFFALPLLLLLLMVASHDILIYIIHVGLPTRESVLGSPSPTPPPNPTHLPSQPLCCDGDGAAVSSSLVCSIQRRQLPTIVSPSISARTCGIPCHMTSGDFYVALRPRKRGGLLGTGTKE